MIKCICRYIGEKKLREGAGKGLSAKEIMRECKKVRTCKRVTECLSCIEKSLQEISKEAKKL